MAKIKIIKSSSKFSYIIKNGYGLNSPFFIFYLKKDDIPAEFGICAGKKLGCAVTRNRAKRRIRELIRFFIPQFDFKGSLVIMARRQTITANFESLKKSFFEMSQKLGIIKYSQTI